MADHKLVDGGMIWLTPDEQAEHDARIAAFNSEEAVQARLIAALAAHRYDVQNGGTTVNSVPLKTDAESRSALTAAYIKASSDPAFSVIWKAADGSFVTLSAAQIIALGDAVLAFVQQCFDTEAALTQSVADYDTAAAIISAFDEAMT